MAYRPNTKSTFVSQKNKSDGKFNKKTFANLEVKVPHNPKFKKNYRWKESMSRLHALIQDYGIAEQCMVQSFDHEALQEMERINREYVAEHS